MHRTTVSLEDRLAASLKAEAAARGQSVSALVAAAVSDALKKQSPRRRKPFRLVTVGGAGIRPGVDLDRPRALEVAEDVERFGGDR